MKNILVDIPLHAETLERLRALPGVNAVQVLPEYSKPRTVSADLLRGQHVLLCKAPPLNFEDLTDLEVMQLTSVGYEHLRHLKLGESRIRVCNARGIFETAIAEWVVAMMANLARDLRGMIRNQEHGVWMRSARFQHELRGGVVGLWGYGGIGRETARLAKTLGMTVHVLSRSGVGPRGNFYALPGTGDPEGKLPDKVFRPGQELAFLEGLDYLVLALPQAQNTTSLLGEKELRALRPTAYLLNPARGPIVDEQALLRALREAWIAGAALDTHYAYPLPADHPLWRFPNVILTPHISGADHSQHFLGRMGDLFLQNVGRHVAGQPLLNELTREEWREA